MTNEQAKEIVKRIKDYMDSGECWSESEFMAMDMAIKALSQEPCEDTISLTKEAYSQLCLEASKWNELQKCDDAISREAVVKAIEHEDKWLLAAKGHNGLTEIAFSGLKARVDALPSVTQKSGYWIEGEIWEDTDGGWGRWQKCSVCRQSKHYKTNFCPDCGAKMESEVGDE